MPLIPVADAAEALAESVRRRTPLGPRRPGGDAGPTSVADTGRLRTLEDVLGGRRSVRAFEERPLERQRLLSVLERANATQRRQWPHACHSEAGLRLLIAARRINGLPEGLYDAPPDRIPTTPPLAVLPDGLAQDYVDAPALVLVCGDSTANAHVAAGDLLVRAGSLGYAVWLAARTHGLECSVFGAANAAVRVAAARFRPGIRHLFTVAVGYPE